MNSVVKKSGGRIVIECLLAVSIAIFSPMILMSELVMGSMVFMLPAIGYVFLKNYAGKPIATLSSIMMLVSSAFLLGPSAMWMMFTMNIIPQIVLQTFERRSFGSRMQSAVIAFLLGAVLAGVVMYVSYGGNMVESYFGRLPETMRELSAQLPEENINMLLKSASRILGREFATMEAFLQFADDYVLRLVPLYQLNMPGMLLSGAGISAAFAVWLDGWMKNRRGNSEAGVFVPVHEWYLPASTTGGLLMIFGIGLVMYYAEMQNAQAVFMTVMQLAVAAFCVQGFASVRRKFKEPKQKVLRTVMSLVYLWLAMVGVAFTSVAPYLAIYGAASAIFGSGGVIKQRFDAHMAQNRSANKSEDNNNEDEDKDE